MNRHRLAILGLALMISMFGRRFLVAQEAPSEPVAHVETMELPPLQKATGLTPSPSLDIDSRGVFTEFRRLTQDTLSELPRLHTLQSEGRDFHSAPAELMKASPLLAKVADALQGNEALAPQGIEFYDTCARDEEMLTAVRAVCLRHLRHWVGKQSDANPVRPQDYAEEVWRLSEALPAPR